VARRRFEARSGGDSAISRIKANILSRAGAEPRPGSVMSDNTVTAAVAARMRQQHGLISLEQLERLGMTRGTLRTAVKRGWLAPAGPRGDPTPAPPATRA
jgi:hypothetical protein